MVLSIRFLLLLVAHSVSAVHKERQALYHVHTVHFSPFHNTNHGTELTAAVLTDGENMVSEWTEDFWSRTRMKKQKVPREFEVFIDLLEISYNDTGDIVKRHDCEVERSSSGDVTLLNPTAECRLNGKVILHFNVDTVQCVVLDSELLPAEVVPTGSPSLSQIYKEYLVQRCMEEILGYLDDHEDSRRTDVTPSSEDEDFISGNMLLLLCIIVWVFWRERNKDHTEVELVECNASISLLDPSFYTEWIHSIIFRIKKKMRKRKVGKPPVNSAYREDLNVMDFNDDHDARDADQTERRSVASMDIPLTLAGEDDCGQIRKIVISKDKLTQTARLITAGGHLGSRTISVPAFEMEGEESDHRGETNPQDPLLLALIERFAASMDIPLTLAENDDTQKLSEDGLAQTAGLTTAGGRSNFIHASLPNLERIDSSDSQ
ncbi:uncharacterized protein LOC108412341 isoform X2 [Pygocentrus nattereri]|uniref:uncharacterized protein LOC108412341 isoform X2 n=1 Tax=Pygocentrus nattereri TaxID=42514 RepID=UPI00081447CC|nr:uncharacterized protein LOC108412341 isoform X2 [Pygocentrus nattereri]